MVPKNLQQDCHYRCLDRIVVGKFQVDRVHYIIIWLKICNYDQNKFDIKKIATRNKLYRLDITKKLGTRDPTIFFIARFIASNPAKWKTFHLEFQAKEVRCWRITLEIFFDVGGCEIISYPGDRPRFFPSKPIRGRFRNLLNANDSTKSQALSSRESWRHAGCYCGHYSLLTLKLPFLRKEL